MDINLKMIIVIFTNSIFELQEQLSFTRIRIGSKIQKKPIGKMPQGFFQNKPGLIP